MNYLQELNAFNRWCEINSLDNNSRLMWYILIDLFNRCGWQTWIRVDNRRMMYLTRFKSEDTLIRARTGLINNGLIEYQKGKKGSPNKYKIISVYTLKNEVQTEYKPSESRVQTSDINKHKDKNKNKHNIKNNKKVKPQKTFDESSEPYGISLYLFEKIKEIHPQHKQPNLQTWAKDADLMLRVDKRDVEDVRAVIDFATRDDFWSKNILSVNKFRKHFDKLHIQMGKQGKKRDKNLNLPSDTHSYDFDEIIKKNYEELERQLANTDLV